MYGHKTRVEVCLHVSVKQSASIFKVASSKKIWMQNLLVRSAQPLVVFGNGLILTLES
jgi:hypothetical protein